MKYCPVCGGSHFAENEVLWEELITEWDLSPLEVDYMNRQQGFGCQSCGNNMRSMALASAILKKFNYDGVLVDFVRTEKAVSLSILEVNEAGGLTPILKHIPGHKVVTYPEYDMTNLPFESAQFDLILHSDTLEHVSDPIQGLKECKRLLNSRGTCIFTVPFIFGRLSRSREGMNKSYHGQPKDCSDDYLVYSEFGADVWVYAANAGFTDIRFRILEFPSGVAIEVN